MVEYGGVISGWFSRHSILLYFTVPQDLFKVWNITNVFVNLETEDLSIWFHGCGEDMGFSNEI